MIKMIDRIFNFVFRGKENKGLHQFFRYLFCGGAATVSDVSVLFILNTLLGVNHLIAAAFAFGAGIATNYSLNTSLVFKSSGKIKKELTLFALIGIGGLAWTELILWILVDRVGFYVMAAKMVAVVLVLNWNFFMRKKFVFSIQQVSPEKAI